MVNNDVKITKCIDQTAAWKNVEYQFEKTFSHWYTLSVISYENITHNILIFLTNTYAIKKLSIVSSTQYVNGNKKRNVFVDWISNNKKHHFMLHYLIQSSGIWQAFYTKQVCLSFIHRAIPYELERPRYLLKMSNKTWSSIFVSLLKRHYSIYNNR